MKNRNLLLVGKGVHSTVHASKTENAYSCFAEQIEWKHEKEKCVTRQCVLKNLMIDRTRKLEFFSATENIWYK